MASPSSTHKGWWRDIANSRLAAVYNGTEVLRLTASTVASLYGFLSSHATSGIGYSTGAGGAVTQITSRATGVTLNTVTGQITTDTTSLAAGAEATFTVTNSAVAATDVVVVNMSTITTGTPVAHVTAVAAGSFDITITNLHASTADTSADVINFAVIKGVAA